MHKRLTVLAVLTAALLAARCVVAGQADDGQLATRELEVAGKRMVVWPLGTYRMNSGLPLGSPTSYAETYYVHVGGSIHGMLPRTPGAKTNWSPIRSMPIRPSDAPGQLGAKRGQTMWFQRAVQHKHETLLPGIMGDYTLPFDEEFGEMERLHLIFLDLGEAMTSDDVAKALADKLMLSRYVAVQADEKPKSVSECVLFESDWEATSFHGNISVIARMNYSDIKDRRQTLRELRDDAAFIAAIVYARDFLERPFPKAQDIMNPQSPLIERFELEQGKLKSGLDVPVTLSFGVAALQSVDIIRLKTDNGGFRREGDTILYRPAKPGEALLILEAMSGLRPDGEVEYAQKNELRLTVGEQ